MKKVIVVGLSGAGKTTLANQLSAALNIRAIELDSIYHQADWKPLDREVFIDKVNEITAQKEWILCGNFFTALGKKLWKKADTIIWCDYPLPLVLWRLIRRTFYRGITKQELWNGNKESLLTNFFTKNSVILLTLRSWKKHKKRYGDIFDNHPDISNATFVRLRSKKDTEKFLLTVSYKKLN